MLFLYPGCVFLPSCKVQSSPLGRFLDRFWDHKIILWKQCKWAVSARIDEDEISTAVLLDTSPQNCRQNPWVFLSFISGGCAYIHRYLSVWGALPCPRQSHWKQQCRVLPAPRRDFSFASLSLSHHFLFHIAFSSRCCSSARPVPSQNRPCHFSLRPSAVPRGAWAQPARGDCLSRHRRFCAYFHLLCISMAELLRCCWECYFLACLLWSDKP